MAVRPGALAQAQVGVGAGKALYATAEEGHQEPDSKYRRLRARGSGSWDRASRRVMVLLYPKGRLSVKSDQSHAPLSLA